VTAENVRQAREAAGSFSAPGAVVGAVVGALLAVAFLVVGGETMRANLVAVLLGAPALIFAFAAIGALTGRAKLFQAGDYRSYEREIERGDALVSVSGPAEELARAREILKRRGATSIRHEETGEAL
jgi:3-hydroxyisobutyrate dehydrogenase-like beta-hydroxyacid dehydrogenase